MSLLLEALRKAERQTQRSSGERAPASEAPVVVAIAPPEMTLEPVAAPEPAALRIADDESRSKPIAAQSAGGGPRLGAASPRLPFYLALGLLGVVASAALAYFWLQLQPAPAMARGNPQRALTQNALVPAESAPAQLGIPGLPPASPAPAVEPAAVKPQAVSAVAASVSSAQTRAEDEPAGNVQAHPVPLRRDSARIHPQVESGYAALQSGDVDAARAAYQLALRDEPGNRDAILGMAALETHAGRFDLAEAHHLRLLQVAPRDPYAQAGLLALRAERIDALQAESRLKTLLAADTEATPLHFSLGNQFARQGRWAEAQQAYFQALAGDPEHPDFAFNLAVSLDRLYQPAQAMAYYRLALALAERRVASFAPEAARLRLQQLAR